MAMVIKRRARSALANGFPNTAIYPHGVGGIDGHNLCVCLEIGDIRVIMTNTEYDAMLASIARLKKDVIG